MESNDNIEQKHSSPEKQNSFSGNFIPRSGWQVKGQMRSKFIQFIYVIEKTQIEVFWNQDQTD